MREQEFEIKTSNGTATWVGSDGKNACERYADAHPGVTVYAWRTPRYQLVIGMPRFDEGAKRREETA